MSIIVTTFSCLQQYFDPGP